MYVFLGSPVPLTTDKKSTHFANTTHCLDYYICTEFWNEVNASLPNWVFSKIVLIILITLLFHINFRIRCWCMQKILMESWLQLHWLYRSIWGCTFFWKALVISNISTTCVVLESTCQPKSFLWIILKNLTEIFLIRQVKI